MKIEIIKKTENPLLKRTEVEFEVDHAGSPTPKRLDVRAQLATLLDTSQDLLVIEKLASAYGKQTARGIARVYTTREQLEAIEPKHLLKRGVPKGAQQEKPVEEKPKKAEEKPKEAKQEKPVEEKPKEAEEKPKEAKEGGEGS